MYKNILVPIALDHERDTDESLKIAKALADDGAQITALYVMEDVPAYVAQYLPEGQIDTNRAELNKLLKEELHGVEGVKTAVVTGHPGHTIVEYADDQGIDLIVVASHRPGMQDFFLGSTAARVVRHAHCAVHVIR